MWNSLGILEVTSKVVDSRGVTQYEKSTVEIKCVVRRPSKQYSNYGNDNLTPDYALKAILITSPEYVIEAGVRLDVDGRSYTTGQSWKYTYHQEVHLS